MLCCLGLLVGLAAGSMLGGPWTLITPAMGFGLGLIGDVRLALNYHEGHRRGYCGDSYELREKTEKSAKDLVCGMQVDEKITRYKMEFGGKTYYFCSSGCESAFQQNPERYAWHKREKLCPETQYVV